MGLSVRTTPFQGWIDQGVLGSVLEALAEDLRQRGKVDLSECYVDGTFAVAKKGESVLERPNGARVRRSWRFQIALLFLSLRPHRECFAARDRPCWRDSRIRLSEGEAASSDRRQSLRFGPARRNTARRRPRDDRATPEEGKDQDIHKLRRYKRGWKTERLFAWLFNFRRLVGRYGYEAEDFLVMVQLGCVVILLRKCL
jgi:transposase